MITLFDPNMTAREYLKLAAIEAQLPEPLHWFLSPAFDFGFNAENVALLVEQRPEILVHATWNGVSNIKVGWGTLGDGSLKVPDERRELLWFRRFKQGLNQAQLGSQAGLYIVYAHIARYNQLLNEIRSAGVSIVRASRIAPCWEFAVEIFESRA